MKKLSDLATLLCDFIATKMKAEKCCMHWMLFTKLLGQIEQFIRVPDHISTVYLVNHYIFISFNVFTFLNGNHGVD